MIGRPRNIQEKDRIPILIISIITITLLILFLVFFPRPKANQGNPGESGKPAPEQVEEKSDHEF